MVGERKWLIVTGTLAFFMGVLNPSLFICICQLFADPIAAAISIHDKPLKVTRKRGHYLPWEVHPNFDLPNSANGKTRWHFKWHLAYIITVYQQIYVCAGKSRKNYSRLYSKIGGTHRDVSMTRCIQNKVYTLAKFRTMSMSLIASCVPQKSLFTSS